MPVHAVASARQAQTEPEAQEQLFEFLRSNVGATPAEAIESLLTLYATLTA